jgi:agmatine/peptidylarginine deiminase
MNTKKRRMLAEWERQSAVQLTWPHKDTDWAPILSEITAVYKEMAHEISLRESLLIVDDIPHNDTWARDHGFITVEEEGQLILLDF